MPDALPVHIAYMKDLAMQNVKQFSRLKRKDDIKAYMDMNLMMGSQFVLGLPMQFRFDLRRDRTFQKVNDNLIV
jgi:hypothetical protein